MFIKYLCTNETNILEVKQSLDMKYSDWWGDKKNFNVLENFQNSLDKGMTQTYEIFYLCL